MRTHRAAAFAESRQRSCIDVKTWRADIAADWRRLQFAPLELRADRKAVLSAVKQDGHALEFAEDTLRADSGLVLVAVRQTGEALRIFKAAVDQLKDIDARVQEAARAEAVAIAKKIAEDTIPGRSADPNAKIGPLVSQVQWDKVQGYLKKGIEEGARLVVGGPGKPSGLEDGFYVKPTVFADVHNKMTIAQEEVFGPVLAVIPYETEQQGIDIANDTIYGLNNAVGSSDPKRALRVASKLRSGMVMVNRCGRDTEAPFGGYKQSGNAREWGLHGVEEFLLTKSLAGSIKDFPKAKL